jgi:hypothetical protein
VEECLPCKHDSNLSTAKKVRERNDTDTEGRWACEDEGKDWPYAAASHDHLD